ncbi:DUF3341 domain-containing protein [Shinella sp.]|uniref:DUF3341 domain-containing protein n=1 Tax=Shinella sp. TaxID=1870904 RepID=UPI00301E43E0
MREPSADKDPFGLMAEFAAPEALVDAVRQSRAAGYRSLDAYSPYPIEEMPDALGISENIVPWLCLAGGAFGAAAGYGLQLYANHAYPIAIGGRPLFAWQPYLLITFELMVLFAVGMTVAGMFMLNHLPRLHHPVFSVADFHRASADRFFLAIFCNDPRFAPEETAAFLRSLEPLRVEAIRSTEEPE